jgi:hypothetical protein
MRFFRNHQENSQNTSFYKHSKKEALLVLVSSIEKSQFLLDTC